MLNVLSFLLGILVFGSTAALPAKFGFRFAEVQQCEPVSINFFGDADLDNIPMTLTVLPFDSEPVVIPIPNAAPNSTGVEVTFLPLPAGTAFIASFDDGTGRNTARISDVTHVLPSPTNDSTCLPPPSENLQRTFQLGSDLGQCKELTVNYDTNVVSSAPSVRLFSPGGRSLQLNRTSDEVASGTARYILQAPRESSVLLLINGGGENQETTDILTVMGDSSSDASCLSQIDDEINAPGNAVPSQDLGTGSPALSREAIIGLSVGGGVVGIIAICMLIYIIRERRRRPVNIAFDPSRLEKAQSPAANPNSPTSPIRQFGLNRRKSFIQNPPYTAQTFASPTTPNFRRTSTSSWSQILPQAEGSPGLGHRTPQPDMQLSSTLQSRMSINSLDIEGILNMAAVHSNRASRDDPTPLGPAMASNPPRALPRAFIRTRQHFRDPSDVPRGANSMLSNFTNNPFSDENTGTGSHIASRLLISAFRDSGSIPPSPVGLPVSLHSNGI